MTISAPRPHGAASWRKPGEIPPRDFESHDYMTIWLCLHRHADRM